MRIPIIVPLYKSYHLLEKFASSLELETKLDYRCVFIDNESNKEELDKSCFHKLNPLKYILTSESTNLFYSRSVNKGFQLLVETLEKSTSPFFIVMNPDCFPLEENWLSKFLETWNRLKETDPNICTLGSIQYSHPSKQVIWHMGTIFKPEEQKHHPLDWIHLNSPELLKEIKANNQCCKVDGNTGTGIAIDIEKFKELGGFDEANHPHWSSDADFCLRASSKGYSHYCSLVEMFHNPGQSVKK